MLKKAALIGDITGYGRCALSVTHPVISRMGIQGCMMPTAVISAIPWHDSHFFLDLTEGLEDYIEHWKEIGISFDAVLSGFMCSLKQIKLITGYIRSLKKTCRPVVVADPVMGDRGNLYKMVTPDMPGGMKRLIRYADVITPNLTEACVLADIPYNDGVWGNEELETLLARLCALTAAAIVVKSIKLDGSGKLANLLYSGGKLTKWEYNPVPESYHGCGDLFVAALTGRLTLGDTAENAFITASESTNAAVMYTWEKKAPPGEGLLFEELLNEPGKQNI